MKNDWRKVNRFDESYVFYIIIFNSEEFNKVVTYFALTLFLMKFKQLLNFI